MLVRGQSRLLSVAALLFIFFTIFVLFGGSGSSRLDTTDFIRERMNKGMQAISGGYQSSLKPDTAAPVKEPIKGKTQNPNPLPPPAPPSEKTDEEKKTPGGAGLPGAGAGSESKGPEKDVKAPVKAAEPVKAPEPAKPEEPKPTVAPPGNVKPVRGNINHTTDSHLELRSNITSDGKYWPVVFGDRPSMNPNFIPHPSKNETWFMVAQLWKGEGDNQIWFTELVCEAVFTDGVLECTKSPMIVPLPSTDTDKCVGDLAFWNANVGPHDARVLYGPDAPYIIYGTQSKYACFGQYIQDFRRLVDWSMMPSTHVSNPFFYPTDLQRPPPYGRVEKNWFLFWDSKGKSYLHYDLPPKRVFATVDGDGTAGPNLATAVEKADAACAAKLIAFAHDDGQESNHQATNSLAITLCNRSDPTCVRTEKNTFIFSIFQFKTFYSWHGVYEPYVMLFAESAPFGMHAVSKRPLWVHGRGEAGGMWRNGTQIPEDQTQMIYVTSISWKDQRNTYHGYLDDIMFFGFGIEDKKSGGIDVLASQLIGDLNYCADV